MTNKEKFMSLEAEDGTATLKYMQKAYDKRDMLEESFMIATKVLLKLDEIGWTQKDLAEAMGVKPQQVNKILRGTQNLTLDTIVKFQKILSLPLLATYFEKENSRIGAIKAIKGNIEQFDVLETTVGSLDSYTSLKISWYNITEPIVF